MGGDTNLAQIEFREDVCREQLCHRLRVIQGSHRIKERTIALDPRNERMGTDKDGYPVVLFPYCLYC